MALRDGDAALPNLSISGAALAALLHRCAAATGDCDGLLFGRASHLPAPPASLSDYDDLAAAAPPAPALTISVSSHCSLSHPSSLSDPLGRFHPPSSSDPSSASAGAAVGFFSSRRRTALRPSMRELALAHSLSKTLITAHPLLFILVSPSASPNFSTHSYDYRAFLLLASRLVPASLTVVNVGPGFRDQYHAFSPQSPMPCLPSSPAPAGHAHTTLGESKAVDEMVDGFGIGRLQGILGSAAGQAAEMDDMYAGMLRKLEKLAREVEKSNIRVLEQVSKSVSQILQFLSTSMLLLLISKLILLQNCGCRIVNGSTEGLRICSSFFPGSRIVDFWSTQETYTHLD
ncbi:hypothetical protein PVAP13_3KG042922 [Panicum virgatum]|uniref:Uncharacterized protein n=1 Tax=Panicum virgatum TaxID=38727 RepID=A0A8T0UJV4_PANVG|nr:hypothetical protein PVAP13_3KG042922 [Panicum virgatum]